MSVSLLLLLTFLTFWLRSEYKAEVLAINKEVNFMFMNDIREIEDQFFQELLKPIQTDAFDSITASSIEKIKILSNKEDANFTVYENEQLPASLGGDTSMRVVIRSHVSNSNEHQLDGSISMWVTMDEDGEKDSISLVNDNNLETFALIKEHFAHSVEQAEIELEYSIEETESDSLASVEAVVGRYFDTFSNKNYILQLENNKSVILKKIAPQILFSTFLFSCISLAFYVVFQNLRKQKQLAQFKNNFISNVTHELKTPITTVGVAIEAMSNFDAMKDPEKTKEYLDISQNELKRLSILVDNVLKMSMFEEREPELKLEYINFKEMTQDILATMKLQFNKFEALVQFITYGNAFGIKGDQVHLTSVLYNLIDNALKYSLEKPIVNIALDSVGDKLQLKISDNGIGIPEVYKAQVFDKFFRVPTGDKHNIKGYGLGLSYVAEVVKKHQGTITLQSTEGKGSCFTILLPLGMAE